MVTGLGFRPAISLVQREQNRPGPIGPGEEHRRTFFARGMEAHRAEDLPLTRCWSEGPCRWNSGEWKGSAYDSLPPAADIPSRGITSAGLGAATR